jgi:hypothetical protein
MWRVVVVCAVAACGRTGFASLPCTDAPGDSARDVPGSPASLSKLTLDRLDPMETLVDFPLLVTLDDSRAARDLLDPIASNLRFLDSAGNVLPHEIDQAGAAGINGAPLLAWVRVPSITGLSTTLQVEIGGALPDPSLLSVWGNEYEAVYHLTDGHDSTTHHHDGSPQGPVMPIASPGCAIGACASFDGSSAFYNIPDSSTLDLPMLTVTGWIYQRSSTLQDMAIVSREEAAANQDFFLGTNADDSTGELYGTTGGDSRLTGPLVTLGHWTHLALSYDGSNFGLFVDGARVAMTAVGGNVQHDANSMIIGATMGSSGYLDGMADEIRLEHAYRSDMWIHYEDAAMRDGVISYGPIER